VRSYLNVGDLTSADGYFSFHRGDFYAMGFLGGNSDRPGMWVVTLGWLMNNAAIQKHCVVDDFGNLVAVA